MSFSLGLTGEDDDEEEEAEGDMGQGKVSAGD